MSSITIHDIDDELNNRLSDEARRRKQSKNQLVKDLLAKNLGIAISGRFSKDYHEFCGLWSEDELAVFNNSQIENERVDEGDW